MPASIYLIGVILLLITFTILNRWRRWIVAPMNEDKTNVYMIIIFVIIFWPLAIFIGIIAGVFYLLKLIVIPRK